MQLGRTWLRMILAFFAPMALAASMYSESRTVRTAPRTIREKPGTLEIVRAIIRFRLLAPKAATMVMANRMLGIASRMSMQRMITMSSLPPKKPATEPSRPPTTREKHTATKLMPRLIRAPWKILDRISLPSSSVPKG